MGLRPEARPAKIGDAGHPRGPSRSNGCSRIELMVVVARVESPGAMAVPALLGLSPQYRLNGVARVKARRADDRDSRGVQPPVRPVTRWIRVAFSASARLIARRIFSFTLAAKVADG